MFSDNNADGSIDIPLLHTTLKNFYNFYCCQVNLATPIPNIQNIFQNIPIFRGISKKTDLLVVYYTTYNPCVNEDIRAILIEFSIHLFSYVDNVVFILDCCNPWIFPVPHNGYIQLRSCDPDENCTKLVLNNEKYCNSFTYFLNQELLHATNITYQQLIDRTRIDLHGISLQRPQCTLNLSNNTVFSSITPEQMYIRRPPANVCVEWLSV